VGPQVAGGRGGSWPTPSRTQPLAAAADTYASLRERAPQIMRVHNCFYFHAEW
jgi:hypothetical protein